MKSSIIWLSPIFIAAACASTTNPGAPPGSKSGSSSGSSGSSTGGGTGSSGSAGSSGTGSGSGFAQTCSAPAAGSPILRLLTRAEFAQTLNDIFPQVAGMWTDTLPADTLSPFGFPNDQSNSVGNQQAQAFLDTALSLATALVGTPLNTILPCAATTPNHACAETFVNQYGKRLFRRPITPAEHDRYLAFFDASLAKSNFTSAMKWMTVGMIQSPNAVYRSEIGTTNADSTRTLTPYEVATEVSYTFTGSTPTSDLLTKADSGNLGDLTALAKSLVTAPAGKQALQNFFAGYLGYTGVTAIERPNVTTFSGVAADMVQETQTFIDTIVFQQSGGLKELLTSNITTPSQNLATFYGFPMPATDYASITRPAGQGIGILAQGSFLATHANSTASSPTQRGLFPFTRLLCGTKPPVPSNVPPIPTPQPGVVTTRERYEIQHDDLPEAGVAGCGGCHRLWDPIGFGFEHFDEAGRYRATESGLTIDPSGWVLKPDGSATLFTFPDEEGLMNGLAGLPDSYECFAGYLATYAYGTSQSCLGASQVSALQNGTTGIADAFAALAAELHFTTRAAQ